MVCHGGFIPYQENGQITSQSFVIIQSLVNISVLVINIFIQMWIFYWSPFVILPKHHKNMIEDLEKMLKGEEIDDVSGYALICNLFHLKHKLLKKLTT